MGGRRLISVFPRAQRRMEQAGAAAWRFGIIQRGAGRMQRARAAVVARCGGCGWGCFS